MPRRSAARSRCTFPTEAVPVPAHAQCLTKTAAPPARAVPGRQPRARRRQQRQRMKLSEQHHAVRSRPSKAQIRAFVLQQPRAVDVARAQLQRRLPRGRRSSMSRASGTERHQRLPRLVRIKLHFFAVFVLRDLARALRQVRSHHRRSQRRSRLHHRRKLFDRFGLRRTWRRSCRGLATLCAGDSEVGDTATSCPPDMVCGSACSISC